MRSTSWRTRTPSNWRPSWASCIQETITSADGKIEKVLPRTEEQVTIIPDKNTFSLIVRANRKNQDWIAGLVERLDKRRPQVLIDVTLVEITETEAFNYDLNVITSAPDLTATSGLTGVLVPGQPPSPRRISPTSWRPAAARSLRTSSRIAAI